MVSTLDNIQIGIKYYYLDLLACKYIPQNKYCRYCQNYPYYDRSALAAFLSRQGRGLGKPNFEGGEHKNGPACSGKRPAQKSRKKDKICRNGATFF